MNEARFAAGMRAQMAASPELRLEAGTRVLVLGDLHAGDGSGRDDLAPNGPLLLAFLRGYLERGFTLVLNGDIEELQKFRAGEVAAAWAPLYELLDEFCLRGGLVKIVGNHDMALLDDPSHPYPISSGLRLSRGERLIYVFHGHQASRFYDEHNDLSGALVRHVVGALGIRNLNVSRDSRRKFRVERRIYRFSREARLVSIIGHTHRPLFESLSKYDNLRFAIEGLCREYPEAGGARREEIAADIASFKAEFDRLGPRERRRNASLGRYERSILVPCLFNSGCAVGKKGVTAIEIEEDRISLVYWFEEGRARRYLERETSRSTGLTGTPYRRVELGSDGLDYLFAKLDMLA